LQLVRLQDFVQLNQAGFQRHEDQVGRAPCAAVTCPKIWNGNPRSRMGRKQAAPPAFVLGFTQNIAVPPDGCIWAQLIYMPVWACFRIKMVAQPGAETAGTACAAQVNVTTAGVFNHAQPANLDFRRFFHQQVKGVSAR